MRVVVIGPTGPDTFADNVISSLRALGHEAHPAGPARRTPSSRRLSNLTNIASDRLGRLDEASQMHVVKTVQLMRPDLVLTIDGRLRPATVGQLQRHASHVALWFPDAVSNMGRHEMFLAPYSRIFLKNPALATQLASVHGLPVSYLPEAANPAWHRPVGDYGTEQHVVVVGNVHPTRAVLLHRLAQAGIPLKIYGSPISDWIGFPELRTFHAGREVMREEKSAVFRGARAVLNNLHPAEWSGSNCRLFEATAAGGAVVTEWRDAMSGLYERDREVLGFTSFEELLRHCQVLLADPEPGLRLGDAAASRALADHTYQARLTTMLETLSLV